MVLGSRVLNMKGSSNFLEPPISCLGIKNLTRAAQLQSFLAHITLKSKEDLVYII